MTSQASNNSLRWRSAVTGAVASVAVAAGLMIGVGAATALAQPHTKEPPAPTAPEMTADEALAIIQRDYDLGAGGGRLSNLIHDVLTLRAQGYKASPANREAIAKALEYRPNQAPLIEALEQTLAYQRKMKAQGQLEPEAPCVIGINQPPPGQQPDPTKPDNTGIGVGGCNTINQPIGP